MRIDQALEGVAATGSPSEVEITGIHYDSRRIRPGDLFIAMRGGATDGNRFIPQALAQGAAAIVTDTPEVFANAPQDIPFYLVEHGRRALATIAANLLDHPERKLKISAVTGTNGKTTTAFLLEQMLRSVGRKCVLIGTIETHIADEIRPSEHTTPEASDLLQLFADGVAAGCTEVVMEMSSHALDQERVWGIPVDVAIFTNLTQDHLDYHGTMQAYFAAKARLFEGVGAPPPRVAAINVDDEYGAAMAQQYVSGQLMTYGARNDGDRFASFQEQAIEDRVIQEQAILPPQNCHPSRSGGPAFHPFGIHIGLGETTFTFVTPAGSVALHSPLSGRVNVYNLLAASCAALARGLTLEEIAAATAALQQVPGRFQVVPGSKQAGLTVVVDYAHTDDALRNLITLARELVGEGRVITLFGCGGDRDRTKRPKMGRAAAELSDLVLLTSDNPRTEDPQQILAEALAGVRETATACIVEPDRATAIKLAIEAAKPGDIVLLAGKGHEKIQILRDRTIPFDDVAVAAQVLQHIAGA